MRRHAKASSAGSKLRKPSGHGASPPSGRLRLTILLATVAAFLLVPAAQAFATDTATVNIAGTGNGEVSSAGGVDLSGEGFGENEFEGEPPIECSYASPGPATGACSSTMGSKGGSAEEFYAECCGIKGIYLKAIPAPGTEFTGWAVEEGGPGSGCEFPEEKFCLAFAFEGGDVKVTATFECEVPGTCEEPSGPTNRRALTVTKSAGGSGGIGTVSSKPKGIKCGAACNSATGSFYKNSSVVLTAKPTVTTTKTSTFVKWEGGDCEGLTTLTCTVTMDEAEAVTAVFGGESKPILEPQPLTLSKEGSGFGTVKASGLGCEAECTETTVLYQGETAKPAKIVILTATPAFGSEFVEWGGACEGSGSCEVSMASPQSVTATFTAKPNGTLTVTKSAGGSGGTGTVSSKPKGIKCAATCTTQSAAIPQGESIVLTAKPTVTTTKTSTFVEWEGGDCDGLLTLTCTVTMDEVEAVTAVFGGESKPILEPQPLTLSKEGTGFGTVKASGLACEALCTSATSLYQGETAKPAKIVILTATSAPGSKPVVWSGCTEITPTECEVSMASPQSVTATFDELE